MPAPGGQTRVQCWGDEDLPLRDYGEFGKQKLIHAFRRPGLDKNAIEVLHESLAHESPTQALPGFADLLGLWSDWVNNSIFVSRAVENSFPMHVVPMGKRSESRVVWRFALRNGAGLSDCLKRVLAIYDEWEDLESLEFNTGFMDCWGDGTGPQRKQDFFQEYHGRDDAFPIRITRSPGSVQVPRGGAYRSGRMLTQTSGR